MNFILISIYAAILFFVFSPSVLVSLPPKGSIYIVAATHAILFGIFFFITARYLLEVEGLVEGKGKVSAKGGSSTNVYNPAMK
uniref:Uncharacterized protein n=1 Tax=viral metagenome TaxID=1070528 RepID=A0A6C0I431_9ZZZZ